MQTQLWAQPGAASSTGIWDGAAAAGVESVTSVEELDPSLTFNRLGADSPV